MQTSTAKVLILNCQEEYCITGYQGASDHGLEVMDQLTDIRAGSLGFLPDEVENINVV